MKRSTILLVICLVGLPLGAATTLPPNANISSDQTWTPAGSPYILTGNVTVSGPNNPVLTIEKNVEVRANQGAALIINNGTAPNKGTLIVNGTVANPVRFMSNGTPTRGFWSGLYFGNAPEARESFVSNAVIEHAGSISPQRGGVTTTAESLIMKEVTVRENLTAGVLVNGGDFGISFSEVSSNSGPGINAVSGAVLRFSSVRFLNNSGVAVTAPAAMLLQSRGSNVATGNAAGGNGLEIRGGTLNSGNDWFLLGADFPYLVSGTVIVRAVNASASVPVLRIKAGNKVRFRKDADLLISHNERGALQVEGTAQEPVLFTSDGPATPGHWVGIGFGAGATATTPPSRISYATIEYAGSTGLQRGGIDVRSGSVTLDHVTVRNSLYRGASLSAGSLIVTGSTIASNGGPGIYATGGALSITDNTFTNNLGYAVSLPATVPLASASGNSATGNGTGGSDQNAIEYRSGGVNTSITWPRPGSAFPYVVSGWIRVEAQSGAPTVPVLTIAAGNTIRFAQGGTLQMSSGERGALQANGSADQPILFTSNGASTAGYWAGIDFSTGNANGNVASRLSYATIEFAGDAGAQRGGVIVRSGSITLDHVTLRNNAAAGVSLQNGSLAVTDSAISANSGPGVAASGGTLTLTGNTFTNNLGYAVSLAATVPLASASGNSATGNGIGGSDQNAIEYRSGGVNTSITWPRPGTAFPYVVSGWIRVEAQSGAPTVPVLTIAAGNTIKFAQGGDLLISSAERGALQANGSADQPILFTSNGASTPGYWSGIDFSTGNANGNVASRLSYATIEFAGNAGAQRGGVTVRSGSITLDHVTVRNNVAAGVSLQNGSVAVTDSTITANQGAGIIATGGAGLSLDNIGITRNGGNAVDIVPFVPLLTARNVTATDNASGGNGICYFPGTIAASTTWPSATVPYIVKGTISVLGTSAPILTIEPGNEIRFDSGHAFTIHEGQPGALQANGTPARPILFTSNGTPTPGYWKGIRFGASASGPPSRIAYATIEYAGQNDGQRGAIDVRSLSPELDHVVLRNNNGTGLTARGDGTPRISNSLFVGNSRGISASENAKVHATLNYWGSADGPCLEPCTAAQSVTPGVIWEPWLAGAPIEPLYLAAATHKNATFNPLIGTQSFVDYSTSMSAQVTISVRNPAGQLVRTLSGSGSPGSIFWNGRDESGVLQPNGTYKYEIATTAASQTPATLARGLAVIDSSRTLTLSNPTVSQLFFSPNGDSVQDSTTVSAAANFDDTSWTVRVLDASNNVVRTQTASGLTFAFAWNGRNDASAVQPDGLYKLRIEASVGVAPAGASVTKDGSATLDNTAPVAVFSTPTAGVISNVYATGGVTTLMPMGTASDLNLQQWEVRYGLGATPTSWHPLHSASQSVSNGALINPPWETAGKSGVHALKLTVLDLAGNSTVTTVSPINFAHFFAHQNDVHQFNAVAGERLRYISQIPVLPYRVTESIVIKNLQGTVVRNLLAPTIRSSGNFDDFFDGRNDAGQLLPDGPYFYVATVTSNGQTLNWDRSNVMHFGQHADIHGLNVQPYDPFNNKPLTVQYTFLKPARVSVGTSTMSGAFTGNCNTPTDTFFCAADKLWQEAGTHTFTWWGIDHTGSYRTIRNIGIVSIVDEANPFPENAAILFGSKPKLEHVRVTPPVFGPEVGMQTVEFDLSTLNSEPASIKVEFVNLTTKSKLRTVTMKTPAGHGAIEWDGRADSGIFVAPGRYNVIVTATDALGNVVRSGILTQIQY